MIALAVVTPPLVVGSAGQIALMEIEAVGMVVTEKHPAFLVENEAGSVAVDQVTVPAIGMAFLEEDEADSVEVDQVSARGGLTETQEAFLAEDEADLVAVDQVTVPATGMQAAFLAEEEAATVPVTEMAFPEEDEAASVEVDQVSARGVLTEVEGAFLAEDAEDFQAEAVGETAIDQPHPDDYATNERPNNFLLPCP